MIKDSEKLNQLIIECCFRRFTTGEALEHIKKNGIKLGERTYRRYKKELEVRTKERYFEEDYIGRNQQLLLELESLKKIEKERWNLFYSTQNESIKARILQSLEKSPNIIQNYYGRINHKAFSIRAEKDGPTESSTEYWAQKEKIKKEIVQYDLEMEKKIANGYQIKSKQDTLLICQTNNKNLKFGQTLGTK